MYKVNLTAYAEKFEMLPILWIKKTKSLFNSHFSFPSLEWARSLVSDELGFGSNALLKSNESWCMNVNANF